MNEELLNKFFRDTEHIVLIENSLKENMMLFCNFCTDKQEYYLKMFNFFKSKNDSYHSQYYEGMLNGTRNNS